MMTRHTGLITAAARWFRVLVICPLLMWGARAVAQSAETTDSQGLVRIEAPAAMQTYSAAVRSHANAALRLLNEQTGDALHVPVTYIVAENEQQFRALTGGEGENTLAAACDVGWLSKAQPFLRSTPSHSCNSQLPRPDSQIGLATGHSLEGE